MGNQSALEAVKVCMSSTALSGVSRLPRRRRIWSSLLTVRCEPQQEQNVRATPFEAMKEVSNSSPAKTLNWAGAMTAFAENAEPLVFQQREQWQ